MASLDPDSVAFSIAHREVLRHKPMLRELFESFYRDCWEMDRRYFGDCPGRRLEIGSGPEGLPFPDRSLRAVFGINVFHHLSDPAAFLSELLRVVYPGGGAVLIEPYHGWAARILFQRLHQAEGFDPEVPAWEAPSSAGALPRGNQALSYVVFGRDRARFDREFSGLEFVLDRPHTQLRYLLSGGVNFRQLVPTSLAPVVRVAERVFSPLDRWIGLEHTIVLRVKGG